MKSMTPRPGAIPTPNLARCPVRQPGSEKRREIHFAALPPNQAEQAARLLDGLESVRAIHSPGNNSVIVHYDVTEYTLRGLEEALMDQGFRLSNALFVKLVRALVHYCEETQLRNMMAPERLIKKSNEVYIRAWERHPHGDHDDTPPEWREYK